MQKVKVALVGVGGISQVVRIPLLKKMENVELVALCDIDEAKLSLIADKYNVPKAYFDMQNLLQKEKLDGIFICTPNNLHYPMCLAAIEQGLNVLVEKPMALNANQAQGIAKRAREKNVNVVCGMNNRFRDDAMILKEFLNKNEIGRPFYFKCGWLKNWDKHLKKGWLADKKIAGGGVVMDLGIPLIDLALWLLDKPEIQNIRSYFYNMYFKGNIEDSALVVIQTKTNVAITIEVAWKMHLEKELSYTHVFGLTGAAFLNPLRINKELHGNLVNVTPVQVNKNVDLFKSSFEKEIHNFIDVLQGKAKPVTPVEDGVYLLSVIDAIYKSAELGKQVDL